MRQQDRASTTQTYYSIANKGILPIRKVISTFPSWIGTLWRYRAPIAGVSSIGLAVVGEWLMRAQADKPATNPALGALLMQAAVLLVGVVAWVHNGLPLPSRPHWFTRRKAATPPQLGDPDGHRPQTTLPIRECSSISSIAPYELPGNQTVGGKAEVKHFHVTTMAWLRTFAHLLASIRARIGRVGTLTGLLIVTGLALWLGMLVRDDYANSFAPWLWIIMLVVLALTVRSMSIWPRGASLVPQDPGEPAMEPPVDRREWLLVAALLLVAAALRLWNLEYLPNGIYIDEADQILRARMLNRGLPLAYNPYSFFSTDWWGVPTAYFWGLAQSLKVFGDNQLGARLIHALAGIGTVWFTYRTGRVAWSPRVGLLAGALLAVSDIAIHFSRSVTVATISQFGAAACFYFVYKALKTRRSWDWMMAGLMAAFAYYGGYASAKILLPFLAVIGLFVLIRWGLTGIRCYLPGLVVMGVALTLALMPHFVFQLVIAPDAFGARTNTISIFAPQNAPQIQAIYQTTNWPTIVYRQYQETYKAFDVTREMGHFYPTGHPVLPVPWAALWVLGTAYVVWRMGDVRFAILGMWLLSGLTGAALTTDAPSLQRMAGMIPTLALIPAAFMDRVAFSALRLPRHQQPALMMRGRLSHLPRPAVTGLVVLFVIGSGIGNLWFYVDVYNRRVMYNQHNFTSGLGRYEQTIMFSLVGRYAQTLDKDRNMIALWPNGAHYLVMPPMLFYLDGIESIEIGNLTDALPYIHNKGKIVNFVIYNSHPFGLRLLQQYFPGGEKIDILQPDGQPLAWVYRVDPGLYNAVHQSVVQYGPPEDPRLERMEPQLGTPDLSQGVTADTLLPPTWLTYPARAKWVAGLVVPAFGSYTISVTAPFGAELKIGGRTVFVVPPGSYQATETTLVLGRGMHRVELSGELQSAQGRIELRWAAAAGGPPQPVARRFIWNGPQGALLVQAYTLTSANDPAWYTTPELPTPATPPFMVRLDGFAFWGTLNAGLLEVSQAEVVWRGKFGTSVPGSYGLDAVTSDRSWLSLWVDGKLVGVRGVPAVAQTLPASIDLAAGQHTIELRLGMREYTPLELYWQPPNEDRALMPPGVLMPAEGGAWSAAEMPDVPSPDPNLLAP